jgi:hypothetical protein
VKTKGKGTFLPEQYQMPVMIIGAIILVVLFVWRINGGRFGGSSSSGGFNMERPPEAMQTRMAMEEDDAEEARMQRAMQEEAMREGNQSGMANVVVDRTGQILPPTAPILPNLQDVETRTSAYLTELRNLKRKINEDDTYIEERRLAMNREMHQPVLATRDPFHPTAENSTSDPKNPLAFLQNLIGESGEILDPQVYEEMLLKMNATQSAEEPSEPLRLQGTMTGGERASAIISGQHLTIGDTIDGYKVMDIQTRSVKLLGPTGLLELKIPQEALIQ